MYPVDLMKVCKPSGCRNIPITDAHVADPYADHQSYLRQPLYRHLECRIHNIQTRRPTNIMARHDQRHRWSRYELDETNIQKMKLMFAIGPAHAVYFGTYEVVKDLAGGNATDGKHHPLAAGMCGLFGP